MIALMLKALKYVSESILTDSDDKKSVIGIGYKKILIRASFLCKLNNLTEYETHLRNTHIHVNTIHTYTRKYNH